MGLIDVIKLLSTVLSSANNKSQQHQDKNSWECRESNPGLLGEKQVCYLCDMKPPSAQSFKLFKSSNNPLEENSKSLHPYFEYEVVELHESLSKRMKN